jgi:hypothetical protein
VDLDAYRAAAQAFATDLNAAHRRRFAGLDAGWDPAAVHERHATVWDERAIDALRAAGPQARPLLRFAVETRLGAVTAEAEAERAAAEAEEGLSAITASLAAEDEPAVRVQLEEARLDVVARRLTPPAAKALERVREQARALGWPSARAMWSELHGVDLAAVAAEAQALLRATAPPDLGDAVARHDLPRLHRATWADAALPADPVAHLHATLDRLGLPARFTLDAAPRTGKSPRAFCAAVHVPDDVHLVVAADGGLPQLTALFHEAGHAVHLSLRDANAPFEARHLVDRAHAEAIAFAFEALAVPAGDPALDAHVEAVGLLRARRLAAALLHDLDLLDEGPVLALRERYARRMAAATGLAWPSAPWLATADPLLSSADYLRALGRARRLDEAALADAVRGP